MKAIGKWTHNDILSTMNQPTNQLSASTYRRKFWKSAIQHLPNHLLLKICSRSAPKVVSRALLRYSNKYLMKEDLLAFDKVRLTTYRGVVINTKLWHGTGRFAYVNGKIVDIFELIVEQGSLQPVSDHYATLLGGKEMESISTTPLRIIARTYADTYGLGERETHRYGSSMFWVSYYYGFFYAELFSKYMFLIAKNYHRWNRSTVTVTGDRAWGKKVNKQAGHVWDVFGSGSDIPGNYPILFGIVNHSDAAKLPKIMAKVEVRLIVPVTIEDLSHIEVPASKVDEITELLRGYGYNTPVFPVELGEYESANYSVAELLDM